MGNWQKYLRTVTNIQISVINEALEDPEISELDFYKLIHGAIADLMEWNMQFKHKPGE